MNIPIEKLLSPAINIQRDSSLELAKAVFDQENPSHWQKITQEDLFEHITSKHLLPLVLSNWGLPNFDIELAITRQFDLVQLCTQIYSLLSHPPADWQKDDPDYQKTPSYLIKTLLLIELKKPDTVDWQTIRTLQPNFQKIQLNLITDIRDHSFIQMLAIHQSIQKTLKPSQS